jgi:hypothetical protein
MARKDLLGSTEKQGPTAKTRVTPKKSTQGSTPKKKATKQQRKAGPGAAREKKAAAKSRPAAKSVSKVKKKAVGAAGSKAKAKATAKTRGKKATAPRRRKESKKDLLFRKFEMVPAEAVVAEYKPAPPEMSTGPGGTSTAVKAGLGVLAVLILIIIGTSFSNRGMFYLKNADGGVQVWRGKFAPIGKELALHLEGMEMPSPAQDVYSKEEVYPMAFRYFLDKADGLLNDPGGPDFSRIKGYLHQAAPYAPTGALRNRVQVRLNGIDFLVLLHRADIALINGTLPDLQAAKGHLDKAASYASSGYQREQLAKTMAVLERAIAGFKGR